MKKVCKNCKFWENHKYKEYFNLKPYQVNVCGYIDCTENHKENPKDDDFIMYVECDDDSGLQYELRTGANFSCARFTPKERKED